MTRSGSDNAIADSSRPSPVDPRLLGPEKYRVKAGLPDVKNSGVLLTEARIVNPAGILVQEAASIQASGGASYCNYPGGMTEYLVTQPGALQYERTVLLSPPYGGPPPGGCP